MALSCYGEILFLTYTPFVSFSGDTSKVTSKVFILKKVKNFLAIFFVILLYLKYFFLKSSRGKF